MASFAGTAIIRLHQLLTALFVITALYAAIVFDTSAQWVGAVTAMVLFSVGIVVFLWGFWSAVQRSRTEELAVTSVYFLTGGCAPKSVRWQMNSALIIQVITAFATTFWRSSGPDGNPGSSLALGPRADVGPRDEWSVGKFSWNIRRARDRHFTTVTKWRVGIRHNRAMADSASETITIQAPIDRVWEIAADVTSYPSWAHDVKSVNVQSSDDEGRPLDVEFRASALGANDALHPSVRLLRCPTQVELVDGVWGHSAIDRWGVHPFVAE